MNNIKKYELIYCIENNNEILSERYDFIEYNGKIIYYNHKEYDNNIKSLLVNKNLITKINIKSGEFFNELKKIYSNNEKIFEIPNSVEYLKINLSYFSNHKIKLPEKLKVLKIMTYFMSGESDEKVINYPNELFYIYYDSNFNSYVDNLPSSVEILIFGKFFNKPLDNLCSSLKLLCLGEKFSQPLDNLPNSLEALYLSNYYSHELNNL